MAEVKFTTVKSRALRWTRLDECGAPVIGMRSTIVDVGGFSKVTSKFETEAGTVFRVPDAWGDFCVNERDKDRVVGGEVTAEFCRVSPDTHELASGARALVAGAGDTFTTTGATVGYAIGEDTVPGDYMLEAWTKVGGGACVGGAPVWLYTLWPWHTGAIPGDRVLEKGAATFPLTSKFQGASSGLVAAWPYGTPVASIAAGDMYVQRLTLVQPPSATNGAVELEEP